MESSQLVQEPQVYKPLVARPPSAGKATRPRATTQMEQKMEPTLTLGKDVLPSINVIPPSSPQDTSSVPKLMRPSSPATSTAAMSFSSLPTTPGSWPGSPLEHMEMLPKIRVDLRDADSSPELDSAAKEEEDEDLRAKLRDALDGMQGTCMRLRHASDAELAKEPSMGIEAADMSSAAGPFSQTSPEELRASESPDAAAEIYVERNPETLSLADPSFNDDCPASTPSSRPTSSEKTRRPPSSPTRRLREALERGKALAMEVMELPVPEISAQNSPGVVFFDEKTMFLDTQCEDQKDLELAALRHELRAALQREEALRRPRSSDTSEGELLELRSRVRLRDEIVKAKSNEISSLTRELQQLEQNREEQRATSAVERLQALTEVNIGLRLELEDMRRGAAAREARKEYPRYEQRSLVRNFMRRPSSARSVRPL